MAWMDNYRAGCRINSNCACLTSSTATIPLALSLCSVKTSHVYRWRWCGYLRHGVPCIYYGDEVGLDGNNDPFCRKPFPWQPEKQDANLLALYQRLAKLRHQSRALRHGGCQVIYAEDNVVVFVRVLNRQRVLVAINRGRL